MDTKDNKLTYNRKRSVTAALTDGYHLFLHYFPALLRRLWPLLAVYTLVCGAIGYLVLMKALPGTLSTGSLLSLIGALAAYIVTALLIMAAVKRALTEHRVNDTIGRGRWYGTLSLREVPGVFRVAGHCLRHFAHYLPLLLIITIVVVVLTIFMECPIIYLSIAHQQAHASALAGDVPVMPEHIGLLTFVVSAFCGFFQSLIHTCALFPLYYRYR